MIVPARFRELLDGTIYLTQGFDHNLRVLPEAAFVSIYERVTEMSSTNPTARQLRRLIFSTAQQVDIDNNGRILIPKYLREVAHLSSEAIVVGVGEALEIWSPDAWDWSWRSVGNLVSRCLGYPKSTFTGCRFKR